MPEEARSESNKKKLVLTLVHFLRMKNHRYTKTILIKFIKNLIAHLIVKISSFISVNTWSNV
jgi:hypothetical protein